MLRRRTTGHTSPALVIPCPTISALLLPSPQPAAEGNVLANAGIRSASGDARYEIFIRADLAIPIDVLGVLMKELHPYRPARRCRSRQTVQGSGAQDWSASAAAERRRPRRSLMQKLEELPRRSAPCLTPSSISAGTRSLPSASQSTVPRSRKRGCSKHGATDEECGYTLRVSAQVGARTRAAPSVPACTARCRSRCRLMSDSAAAQP